MCILGDVLLTQIDRYYEGKEFETSLKEKKPGDLSPELVEALSIPPLAPPPWLISMQRFGPPPSYPTLRIPGLNAPIPEGAQWGFHPGGWGKPPLDEYNRPLYGDVFGVLPKAANDHAGEPVNKEPWGELEPEEGAFLINVLSLLPLLISHSDAQKRKKNRKRKNQRKKRISLSLLQLTVSKRPLVSRRRRV
jgi:splicing factor 3B subunit 2